MMAVHRSILNTILSMRHCYQLLTTLILPIDYPPPHTHTHDAHVFSPLQTRIIIILSKKTPNEFCDVLIPLSINTCVHMRINSKPPLHVLYVGGGNGRGPVAKQDT